MPQRFLPIGAVALCFVLCSASPGQDLEIDFQPTGGTTASGYTAYEETNQSLPSGTTSYTAFGTSVAVGLSVANLPDGSSDFRAVARNGSASDVNNDWIGVDTRNGGVDVTMTVTVSGLPAGAYEWTSTHHDGGAGASNGNLSGNCDYTFSAADGSVTVPNGITISTQNFGDPVSTFTRGFLSDGSPVSLTMVMDNGQGGGNALFALIGSLSIISTTPPTGPSDLSLSSTTIARSAPIGTLVGTLTSTDPTPGDTFTYTLAGGAGSADNGQFAIDGDRLETDRDLTGFPGGTTLQVRVRTTDAEGAWFERAFLIELVNDSDGDGLDDTWELLYFPDLETASGAGNNDADALTNAQEQAAGTDPTDPDSDGDGLSDSDEVNLHSSDPTLADSDGDGIDDGDEVSAANGHITDPTDPDSDDDGFNDALEIAQGTDPNNGADFPDTLLPLRLNEILARNDTDIDDGFGNREDWIEIHNPNAVAVNLDGYYLTDNAGLLTKWNFPAVSIPAGGYLIVFASGKDTTDPGGAPHTNFQLAADGEFLAIVRPGGSTIDDSFAPAFPEQFTDIAYGLPAAGGPPVFFESSTPGSANNAAAYPGVVKDTNFSIDRGFYDAPFDLSITSDTPGATVRYTTDGSKPTATTGTIYSGPIPITTTTNVRAAAFLNDWLPTNVDTHTYIFVDDVAVQPSDPPGWPAIWGSIPEGTVPSDYEMDPRVVDDVLGIAQHTIRDALLDIPAVSVTMPQASVTGGDGIYTNPRSRNERECAFEYIHPDGTPGFQEDCSIVPHGNSSRNPFRMQKHSLRVTFTSQYGTPKLRYPLFPESEIEEFNKLVLRACFTDSWALASWSSGRYRPNDSMYIRDVWMKDSLKAMGHPSSHGNFVHLYVNGLYFGLHNLTERLEDDFYADHLGGEKEDWQQFSDFSGAPSRWTAMMSVLNSNIASDAVYQSAMDYIDVDNYIDYCLLHFYADSEDWPHHNGYAAANAISGDGKFRFFVWDQEIALDKFSWNRYGDSRGGGAPFQRLRLNEEFRLRFADRVQMHLFNGGALSEEASIARFLKRCTEIDKAIHAESARWGDVQATTPYGNTAGSSNDIDNDNYPPTINNPIYFTREQHWVAERDNVVGHYIPTLHDESDSRSIVNELRSSNLFPSIDAPVFAQHGGVVPTGHTLGVTAEAGQIYYTLDGSDPREAGGAINPGAGSLAGGSILDTFLDFEANGWRFLDTGADLGASDSPVTASNWRHPDFDDSSWGTGQAMLGYGGITGGTINQTVSFGPESADKFITTYARQSFDVTNASDYTELSIGVKRDDGALVYLNGVEIARTNMPAGAIASSTLASSAAGSSSESAVNSFSYTLQPGDLIEGENVVAVEVHQSAVGSSDLGIDVEIKATRPNPGASGVTLTESTTLRARALNNGEWSALTEADFIVGTAAGAGNLVVSELMYNPPGASEDTEWIELMNISAGPLDLSEASFVGIDYAFPLGTVLPAGGHLVVAKNPAAFAAAYPAFAGTLAPGSFADTSLSNSGEEVALLDSTGADIVRFTYNDRAPWPTAPDGDGASLVLIAPETDPDHTSPANWRASANFGGSPGGTDATPFVGDPDADGDRDGLPAFLEYALGSLAGDNAASPESYPQAGTGAYDNGGELAEYLTITYRRNLAADDALIEVEVATDLSAWSSIGTAYVSASYNGDGTETVTYRSTTPLADAPRQFIRLRVSSRSL